MKKTLPICCAVATLALASVVSAQQIEPQTVPVAQTTTPAEDVAVKRYMCNAAAAGADIFADAIDAEESDSMVAQARVAIKSIKAILALPTEGLPAEHRRFVQETSDVTAPYIAQLEDLWNQAEQGAIEEEAAMLRMEEIGQQVDAAQMKVEAAHPESAKLLGKEASKRIAVELISKLRPQATPRVKAYIAEHPEVAKDPKKCTAVSCRIIAEILREAASAL